MEIFIDYRTAKDKIALAQAIRVFALTYKTDLIKVLVDDDIGTLIETDNVKFIKELDKENVTNLYTVDNNYVSDNMIKLSYLKAPKKKKYDKIILGDLADNNLSVEEKYEIFKKYNLIDDVHPFAILKSSIELSQEYKDFIEKHDGENNFLGAIKPSDIIPMGVANILTTSETANVFIDSLYYTVSFLKLTFEEEESQQGFFKSLFSFNKPLAAKAVVINALLHEFDVYLNADQCIFVNKDDMNYNYYFYSLSYFAQLLKSNETK